MKLRRWFGALLAVLLVLSAPAPWPKAAAPSGKEEKTTLVVKGMTCGGCVATVKLKLKRTTGVLAYEVSLDRGEADVTFDPTLTKPEAIAAAVSETGFTATVKVRAESDGGKGGAGDPSSAGARGGGGL